ncbi:hypothetical protein DSM100685_1934 [Bifidobacterium avesanii]|nr:hypothetical protein DSM100685_1934 [Bifidobacterium avesanii]
MRFIELWKDAIKRQRQLRMTDDAPRPRAGGPRRLTANRELILEIVVSPMAPATVFRLRDPPRVRERSMDEIVSLTGCASRAERIVDACLEA